MAEGSVSISSGSEYAYDFFCELCIDDGKQIQAKGYCSDCKEYLCEICYNGHTRSRATRYHVLLDEHDMPKTTALSQDRISFDIATKCSYHTAEPVRFFCKSHEVLGCGICFATVHKSCPAVESILEKSESILDSKNFKSFRTKLSKMRIDAEELVKCSSANKLLSKQSCADAVAVLRNFKKEVIQTLDEIERNMVSLTEKISSEDEEKMKNLTKECRAMSKKIEQMDGEFELLQSSKRVCQLYIKMTETQNEVGELSKELDSIKKRNVVRKFKFEPNLELKNYLRQPAVLGKITNEEQVAKPQINKSTVPRKNISQCQDKSLVCKDDPVRAIGNLLLLEDDSQPARINESGDNLATPNRPTPSLSSNSVTVSKEADIYVKTVSDTAACWITGSAVLPDNRIVVTDCENKKVKLLATCPNRLLWEIPVSSRPWDVTVCHPNLVAVTLPDSQKIILIRVTHILVEEREIPVNCICCYGLTCVKDRLLVTLGPNKRLDIIDMRGKVKKRIEKGADGSALFVKPQYVCASRDGETIYVSDVKKGTVTCLTIDGVVKAVYRDEELKGPRKVCVDQNDNVYVCGYDSKNIHMLTSDCKKVKIVLAQKDELDKGVYTVSHCQTTNRLYVGMGEHNNVKVFRIS